MAPTPQNTPTKLLFTFSNYCYSFIYSLNEYLLSYQPVSPTLLGKAATLGANQKRSLSLGSFITCGEDRNCFTNHTNKCDIIMGTNVIKAEQGVMNGGNLWG